MSLPALAELRRRGPLLAVGSRGFLDLLEDSGLVDRALAYETFGPRRSWRTTWRVARAARSVGVGQSVAFPPSLRAAILTFLTGAPVRRGFTGDGGGPFLNFSRPGPVSRTRHLVDQWLELVESEANASSTPSLVVGPKGTAGYARLATELAASGHQLSDNWLVLAPGATYGPTKRWPARHFVSVAQQLRGRFGWRVLVVGGSDVDEKKLCGELAMATDGVSLAGQTDLPTLAAVLSRARAFVGNDSGPMHLAAAVGTPTLGIFGSTSPVWTAPRGPLAAVWGPHAVPCSPCFRKTCPTQIECLEQLPPDGAVSAVEGLLASAGSAS